MFKSYINHKGHQADFANYAARGPVERDQVETFLGVKDWYVHSQSHGVTILARGTAFTTVNMYLEYQYNGMIDVNYDSLMEYAINHMLTSRGFVRQGTEWDYKLGDIRIRCLGNVWSVTLMDGTEHHNLSGPGECFAAIDHNTRYDALPEIYFTKS